MTPPNILNPASADLWKLFKLGRSFQKLGPGMSEAMEILTGAARPILDRWFESEATQGDAGHRRHHRRLRRPVDARHRLRALPSRHGRNQRQTRRLGLRQAAAWAA